MTMDEALCYTQPSLSPASHVPDPLRARGLAQRQRAVLPISGSQVQFPFEPMLDSSFILHLIAMVPGYPVQK